MVAHQTSPSRRADFNNNGCANSTRSASRLALPHSRCRLVAACDLSMPSILDTAENDPEPAALPPIHLVTMRTAASSTWSREEIYGDDGPCSEQEDLIRL